MHAWNYGHKINTFTSGKTIFMIIQGKDYQKLNYF